MVELEIGQVQRRYAGLRVLDEGRVARLTASIAQEGQRTPVLVAAGAVLVDGYHRLAALDRLSRDLVGAVELAAGEAEALVLAWRLETGRRKSALEDGWLLAELVAHHGRSVKDLAAEMRRPKSWVSGRLGLVRVLPEGVQAAVREGRLPSQSAEKCLVPMARVDAESCQRLVERLPVGVSTRQVERLYAAWRKADPEGRERIVANPGLLLKVEEGTGLVPADEDELLGRDLEGVAGLCRRARKRVREGAFARANGVSRRAWLQASEAFEALKEEVRRGQP